MAPFYIRTQLSRPFINRCCWCCIVYFHISNCTHFGFQHDTNAERNNHVDHISFFANHVVFAIQQFQMFIVYGYAKVHSPNVHPLNAMAAIEAHRPHNRIQIPTISHFNCVQCQHVNDQIFSISNSGKCFFFFLPSWTFISRESRHIYARGCCKRWSRTRRIFKIACKLHTSFAQKCSKWKWVKSKWHEIKTE